MMRSLPFVFLVWLVAALPVLAADGIREESVHLKTGSASAPHGDYADSLAGGPDFRQVTGVAGGDQLNLRRRPSAKAGTVAALRNGTVLRNHGCAMHGGQRWCQVSTRDDPSRRGWVAGRYLRESSE